MSILERRNFLYEEDDSNYKDYRLPSIVTSKPEVIPIQKSLAISTALHPGVVALIWLITMALALMGIQLFTFKKPDAKLKKDIEFVLVDKEAMPRNKNTKNRADINSRSGGINDPKRKVSMPSPAPKKASKPSAAADSANKIIKKQQQQAAQKAAQQKQKAAAKPQTPAKSQQPAAANKPSPATPAPPTARPSVKPNSAPAPVAKPASPFNIARPNAPVGKTTATGPVGGTSSPSGAQRGGTGMGASNGSRTGAPVPSLSPGKGGGNSSLGRNTGSSGGGSGNKGNPGGGGGAPGIDALREPDFGPYMRELQRRIKMNWDPPKGNESKRVVLLFKIAKDGRLLSCRVSKSSGLPSADQAALKAVELTAPFRPLPADFKGQSIDIQFTFDYNVFNASRY